MSRNMYIYIYVFIPKYRSFQVFLPTSFIWNVVLFVSQTRQFQLQTGRLKLRWEHSPPKWLTWQHGCWRWGHVTNRDFDSSSGLLGFWKIGDDDDDGSGGDDDDGGGGDSGDRGDSGDSVFAPGLLVWSLNWMFPFILRHKAEILLEHCGSCDSKVYLFRQCTVSRLKGTWILCVRMSPLP